MTKGNINIADICWGLSQANIRRQFEERVTSVDSEDIDFLASKVMQLYDWNNHRLALNHRGVLRKIPYMIRENYLLQQPPKKLSKVDFASYFDKNPAEDIPFVGMSLLGDTILCEKGLLRKDAPYKDFSLQAIAKNAYLTSLAQLFKAKDGGRVYSPKERSIIELDKDVTQHLLGRLSKLPYAKLCEEYERFFDKFDNYVNLLQKYVDIGMPVKRETQPGRNTVADWKTPGSQGKSKDIIKDSFKPKSGACKSSCDSCSSKCNTQTEKKQGGYVSKNIKPRGDIDMNNPLEMIAELDRYVIGQDNAKKILSVAVSDQYVRRELFGKVDADLMKPNVLMIGPSGCGKTYILDILSQISEIPVYKIALTGLSAAGYVNENVNTVLEPYAEMMKTDPEKYTHGIIFFDEFDKIAMRSTDRDIFTKKLQQVLIKLMDKNTVEGVDASNLMFVAAGAFSGIEDVVRARVYKKEKGLGFGANLKTSKDMNKYSRDELFDMINVDDLSSYGLMPELIGRIGMNVSLHPLGKDELIRIMTESEGSIISDQKIIFEQGYGIKLEFEHGAYEVIAESAEVSMTGARSLMPVCINLLQDYKLNRSKYAKGSTITVTEEYARNMLFPKKSN